MAIFDSIKNMINGLSIQSFYKYAAIGLALFFVIVFGLLYYFMSSLGYYNRQIENINDMRQGAQQILEKNARVEQQRKAVDAILNRNPEFLIAGYFDELVKKLDLSDKTAAAETVTRVERDNYEEITYSPRFIDINMKQLTELLQEIEQNERVYIKELEIEPSNKAPYAIDVRLTIATLALLSSRIATNPTE